jgi:hypothetical protein
MFVVVDPLDNSDHHAVRLIVSIIKEWMDVVYYGGVIGTYRNFNERVLLHMKLFDKRVKCVHCFNTVYHALRAYEASFPDNAAGIPSYYVEDRYDVRPLILLLAFTDSQTIAEVLFKNPLSLMCQIRHSIRVREFDEAPLIVFNALLFFHKIVRAKIDNSNIGVIIQKTKFGVHHCFRDIICWLACNEMTLADDMFNFVVEAMMNKASLCCSMVGCEQHGIVCTKRRIPIVTPSVIQFSVPNVSFI